MGEGRTPPYPESFLQELFWAQVSKDLFYQAQPFFHTYSYIYVHMRTDVTYMFDVCIGHVGESLLQCPHIPFHGYFLGPWRSCVALGWTGE